MNLPINQSNQETMTSSQLAHMLGIEKKEVNRKIKSMFPIEIDGGEIPPSIDNRGYIVEYHLNELYSTMFVAKWHSPFLRKISQYWIDRKQPSSMTPIELIANIATSMVKQEKQLASQQVELSSMSSKVDLIGSKVDKIQDLSDELKLGYVSVHKGWQKYCNVCSYDVFREFATATALPMESLTVVPDGTIAIVETHQVKITDLIKLRDHIVKGAKQKSKYFWEHPDLNHKFKLREL